jgi:hypothetical protein
VTEPVIAYGWQDRVALADVLVLPPGNDEWAVAFARWPGLAMVVTCLCDNRTTITMRDRTRLAVHSESTVDAARLVYLWWSLSRQFAEPGANRSSACGER